MSHGPLQRWRERGQRSVRVTLPFDDIMEFAFALLLVEPAELYTLGWTFADRKRLLDHFLASGKIAQGVSPELLPQMAITLRLPQRDLHRLQRFAQRELPKAASNAALLNRVLRALDQAAGSASSR